MYEISYADLNQGITIHQALVQGVQGSSLSDHHAAPPQLPAHLRHPVLRILE